jgi:hypothetical protein
MTLTQRSYIAYVFCVSLIFSAACTLIRNQYDAIWTARYRELLEYKETYGHTQVPTSYPILGVWVGTQRKQYRLKQRGKYSHMTDERMAMLNSMGFVWEINSWNEKFEELKLFHNQHGHFLVPTGTLHFCLFQCLFHLLSELK